MAVCVISVPGTEGTEELLETRESKRPGPGFVEFPGKPGNCHVNTWSVLWELR